MLTEAVVERIKGAIESGALRAGSAIGQQELADRLGVSRQPIRQALPLLIAEGWIESLPNRRLLVRQLDADRGRRDLRSTPLARAGRVGRVHCARDASRCCDV